MRLGKLTLVLASALMLSATGAAKAATLTAPVPAANTAVMLVAEEDAEDDSAGVDVGDNLTVENGGEFFTDGEEYEVQADQDDDLFVEDDKGDTWNIVSVSDDGDQIELEYDGRTVSGDDVDS